MQRLNNVTATQNCTPYSFTGAQTVLQDFGLQIQKMNNKDTFTFTQTVMHSSLPRTFSHEIENSKYIQNGIQRCYLAEDLLKLASYI